MKYFDEPVKVVELTRRNLEVLLAKLDMPESSCTIVSGCGRVAVRAVENDEHYAGRPAGHMLVNNDII